MAVEQYFVVATVTFSNGKKLPIRCHKKPSPSQLNLLYILCERVGRNITLDEICHRMGTSINGLRINATKLRKRLASDWVISATNNEGMRIIYNGPEFSEKDKATTAFT